jgi:hypothetical protein
LPSSAQSPHPRGPCGCHIFCYRCRCPRVQVSLAAANGTKASAIVIEKLPPTGAETTAAGAKMMVRETGVEDLGQTEHADTELPAIPPVDMAFSLVTVRAATHTAHQTRLPSARTSPVCPRCEVFCAPRQASSAFHGSQPTNLLACRRL